MEFELSRNIAIGQYIPTGSIVHRSDPRTKILSTFFLLVAVSISRSVMASVILLVMILWITKLARLPFAFILRGLMRSLPLLAFFMIIALLYLGWQEPTGRIYAQWHFIRITRVAFQTMALSLLRLVAFVFLVSLPSLTTTVSQLTHGLEIMLLPFQRFGLPAHEIALVNMIALRFVPTLVEELEQVMKAQASRGGEIGNLRLRQPIQMARALLPLVVPLFVNAFRRAEELAIAMEARCYNGGAGRTKYVTLKGTGLDIVVTVTLLILCGGVIFAPWPALHTLLPGL